MPQSKIFHIRDVLDGFSLSQALKQLLRDSSWTEVKKLISGRRVQIHGNLCLDEGRRLKTGDVVKVFEQALAKPAEADDIVIVFRDQHLVVIEKPPGVTTLRHASERDWPQKRKQLQRTLEELLADKLRSVGSGTAHSAKNHSSFKGPPIARDAVAPAIHPNGSTSNSARGGHPIFDCRGKPAFGKGAAQRKEGGPSQRTAYSSNVSPQGHRAGPDAGSQSFLPRIRPVHRLDRDTSGLMLFALTDVAERKLVEMFKHHQITRIYRAVVMGSPRKMTIESHLIEDRGDGLRGSLSIGPGEKIPDDALRAQTHVRPIDPVGPEYTIIECQLETGRTHQIRIHLAEAGHMLCGEKTYTRLPGGKTVRDESNAPRQALHSWTLSMTHPVTGQQLNFESRWPADLAAWLKKLRSETVK